MKRVIPKGQPFAMIKGFWHALEWSRCDGPFPVHKMICGMVAHGTLEAMTGWDEDPKPYPYCLDCTQSFNDPTLEHD